MKQATFFLLDAPNSGGELSPQETLACLVAVESYRMGKRVLIACEDQRQAERLDDALWQRDPSRFVPHNLAGEGPRFGAPIELSWSGRNGNTPRDLLISLMPEFTDFATAFHEVLDFVPYEDSLKQLARERYKAYRSMGFSLATATPPLITTSTDENAKRNG